MNSGNLNESELREFVERLRHTQNGGCSEWVLLDPRTQEIRATGFFTDIDLLLAALPTYLDSYNVQVCRNPRPLSVAQKTGNINQFNRSSSQIVPLEELQEINQTVIVFRPRGTGSTPKTIAPAVCELVVRMGIGKYSVEQGGALLIVRIPMEPTPIVRFGGPQEAHLLFVQLEEAFRDAMKAEERELFEILPLSSPELFDPPVGISQIVGNVLLPGLPLYAPAEKPDPFLPQLLQDLQNGRRAPSQVDSPSATTGIPQLEGLIAGWPGEDSENSVESEVFVEGSGIIPKGVPLKIESEAGKQAKSQIENLDNAAHEGFLRRLRHHWFMPFPSKGMNQWLHGGMRPGEIAVISGSSPRLLQDYLAMALENALRQTDTLGFFASTRISTGDYWCRCLERHSGKPLEEMENLADPEAASAARDEVRGQFVRPPVLLALAPDKKLADLARQIRELRDADETLARLPGILVLDGFDDFCHEDVNAALRQMHHLAQESHLVIWLATGETCDFNHCACDLRGRLLTGEAELTGWWSALPEGSADKATAGQVLPRLFPEVQNGRQPSVFQLQRVNCGDVHCAWQLWYPRLGRFQNLAPRKEG